MRTDILEHKEEIIQWIEEQQSKAFICKQLKCKPETLNSYLDKMGIQYAGRQNWHKNKPSSNYLPAIEYAQKSCVKSSTLLEKLIREGIKKHQCEICGNTQWQGQTIPIELHHIDGNHYNNDFNNLMVLCPNCHTLQHHQEQSFVINHQNILQDGDDKGIVNNKKQRICPVCNKNYILAKSAKMCRECTNKFLRVVDRPERDELKKLIRTLPFTQIGRKYNVSDNAVRKWCDFYNLPRLSNKIKQYSDEEWDKI